MNSLIELKQAIDSMESRIEDNVVDLFQQQLSILGERYAAKTAMISVIKMMQAIGRYLRSRRDTADKDALPVLNSLVIELEKLVTDPELTREQINQILSECIQNYKSLKSKIASQPLVTDAETQDLKAVILAIDWEISEMTLKTFDTVTTRMLARLKSHKILHAYLMIIHSMGRYIASKKATAHKDSLSFLRSVFENFERIVQRPDMPLKEKQELIEKDIGAFYNFKREIASLEGNNPVSIDNPVSSDTIDTIDTIDTMEDEIIQPALSHITASSRQVAEDVVLLNPSSETSFDGQSLDDENLTPALAGRKKSLPVPRDIMEDLFSGKESPADELLDAIHLANVQGPDQKMAILEPTKEELQEEGIKNFTPQRMGNEPIPEIGNRLDEFFNLDISESKTAPAVIEKDAPLEAADDSGVAFADDSSMETIVPFEDESFEETLVEETLVEENIGEENTGEENTEPEYSTQTILNRVSFLVKAHTGLLEEQTAIDRDISYLKTRWLDDSDKTMLVDIISCLLMKTYPCALADSETMVGETETAVPTEQLDNRPSGFWGKIKSIFFKSE